MNQGELKLLLLCHGVRLDSSCDLERDGRPMLRTRAGLGSGVELILAGRLYVNVPVFERFAAESPLTLFCRDGEYFIHVDPRRSVPVRLAPRPWFYDEKTSSGVEMHRIGVMQGTTLGIYPSKVCEFWEMEPRVNCRFCSTGLNVGVSEEGGKTVRDVVEVCQAARKLDKITFVHFNTGYYSEDALDIVEPYVVAVKKETGLLIGVQCPPSRDLKKYDHLKAVGVDHLSFCYEFHNPDFFARHCPGKAIHLGQKAFFEAIEHTSHLFGKGRVSGEIIAGLEPIEDTLRAIDYITSVGAFPTICIFRPLLGTDAEQETSPSAEDMRRVFRHLYERLRDHSIMTGIAPGVRTSLVILPFEASYFRKGWRLSDVLYAAKTCLARLIYGLYFRARLLRFPN